MNVVTVVMKKIILAVALFWAGIACAEETPSARSVESGEVAPADTGAREVVANGFGSLPGAALIAICSNKLNAAELTRDPHGSNAEVYAAIRAIRRNDVRDSVSVLKEVLSHPGSADAVKAEALRALYQLTEDDALVRPWLLSEKDSMRAAALQLLAPGRMGDPSFSNILDGMMARKREYSQTQTGMALSDIGKLNEFRGEYDATTDPKQKMAVLLAAIPWLCDDPPAVAGGEWYVSDNAFSQYLLREFRRATLDQGSAFMNAAITEYADAHPKWKQLAQALINVLGVAREFDTKRGQRGHGESGVRDSRGLPLE